MRQRANSDMRGLAERKRKLRSQISNFHRQCRLKATVPCLRGARRTQLTTRIGPGLFDFCSLLDKGMVRDTLRLRQKPQGLWTNVASPPEIFLYASPEMALRYAPRVTDETRSGVIRGAAASKYPVPCVWQRTQFPCDQYRGRIAWWTSAYADRIFTSHRHFHYQP